MSDNYMPVTGLVVRHPLTEFVFRLAPGNLTTSQTMQKSYSIPAKPVLHSTLCQYCHTNGNNLFDEVRFPGALKPMPQSPSCGTGGLISLEIRLQIQIVGKAVIPTASLMLGFIQGLAVLSNLRLLV